MPRKSLLLSIRPEFAEMVFEGTKNIELRRITPRVSRDDLVVVYVSAPVSAVVGVFRVVQILESSPASLWKGVRDGAGLSRREFETYYIGALKGCAIFLSRARKLPRPIELRLLKELWPGFHPPQSFRYLNNAEVELLRTNSRLA